MYGVSTKDGWSEGVIAWSPEQMNLYIHRAHSVWWTYDYNRTADGGSGINDIKHLSCDDEEDDSKEDSDEEKDEIEVADEHV